MAVMSSYYSSLCAHLYPYVFFFTATATTELYTLSLHDALPICRRRTWPGWPRAARRVSLGGCGSSSAAWAPRSEEHTSELQSLRHLVCRLLLEKKKKK